jgi:hypothetical protein
METTGKIDAVKMMREIRDRLNERLKDMSFEEQKQYIKSHAEVRVKRDLPH